MKKKFRLFAFTLIAGLFWGSCSSPRPAGVKPSIFGESDTPLALNVLSEKKFPGNLGDIAVARRAGLTLVSSIPDPESGGKHLLSLLDERGNFVFQVPMTAPIRSLDIESEGNWSVTAAYEEGLTVWNRKGEPVWKNPAICRPRIIQSRQEVLCIHDDDAKPSLAFEVFSSTGKKVFAHPVKTDLLGLKVSEDETSVALSQVNGRVTLFNGKYQIKREYRVAGEVLDLAVSNGPEPRVAILSVNLGSGQTVSFFGPTGTASGSARLEQHVEQLELNAEGSIAFLYGNSARGQYLAAVRTNDGSVLWQKREPRFADYSLKIDVEGPNVVLGIEDATAEGRRSRVMILDQAGNERAEIPIQTVEGAYLYHFEYSPGQAVLAVASDDRTLRLISLK